MRPDGSSYHVVIPKQIREMMQLKGGEYFLMAASPHRDSIRLKKVEFSNEEEDTWKHTGKCLSESNHYFKY